MCAFPPALLLSADPCVLRQMPGGVMCCQFVRCAVVVQHWAGAPLHLQWFLHFLDNNNGLDTKNAGY